MDGDQTMLYDVVRAVTILIAAGTTVISLLIVWAYLSIGRALRSRGVPRHGLLFRHVALIGTAYIGLVDAHAARLGGRFGEDIQSWFAWAALAAMALGLYALLVMWRYEDTRLRSIARGEREG